MPEDRTGITDQPNLQAEKEEAWRSDDGNIARATTRAYEMAAVNLHTDEYQQAVIDSIAEFNNGVAVPVLASFVIKGLRGIPDCVKEAVNAASISLFQEKAEIELMKEDGII